MSATTVRGIDHVAIAVADADASARWYVEELGLRVTADEIIASANVRLVALAPEGDATGGTFVQLAQPVGPGRIEDFLRAHGEGLQHICFLVDDTVESVTLLGGDPAAVFAGGGGRPMCFLRERPNEVTLEIAQRALARGIYVPDRQEVAVARSKTRGMAGAIGYPHDKGLEAPRDDPGASE